MNLAMLKNCVLVRIKTSSFGNSRKVEVTRDMAEKTLGEKPYDMLTATWDEKIDEALKRLKANKKLVVCPELENIEKYLQGFRVALLAKYANPSFIDEGLYAVLNVTRTPDDPDPEKRKTPLVRMIEDIKAARAYLESELIPAFIKVYPDAVDVARKLWNGSFKERDYPTAERMRSVFGIKYRVVQLDVPEGLPPEIRVEEERKLREEFDKARQQIVEALWVEFQELIAHVVDRLTPGENGKLKTFQAGTIENISAFIEAFSNRNAFNDAKLQAAVNQAKSILGTVGTDGSESKAQRLRDFEVVRNKTAEAFAKLKVEVDAGVTEVANRSFTFDD